MFVSAMSQLWVFGLYELLRTWRQRVEEVIRFSEELRNSGEADREKRIAEKKQQIEKASEAALDKQYYWKPFEAAAGDNNFVDKLRNAIDQTEVLFRRIEALRISLAKHELPKSKGMFAMAPGYGRIDSTDGSIQWQIVLKDNQVDLVSRRTLANECRRIGEDHSKVLLSREMQERVSKLPREGYGITRAAVTLDDGTEYPEVMIAWSKEVVWVKGQQRMPFDARKVVDVRHVPLPHDLEEARKNFGKKPSECAHYFQLLIHLPEFPQVIEGSATLFCSGLLLFLSTGAENSFASSSRDRSFAVPSEYSVTVRPEPH